jgi:hypothetical protein
MMPEGHHHVLFLHPLQVVLDGDEVDPDDKTGVIDERRQGGGHADFKIRDAR